MHGLHLDDAVSGVFCSGDFLTITQIWRTHQRIRAIPTKQVPNTQSLVVIRTEFYFCTVRNYYDATPTYDPNAGTAKFVMAMSVVQVTKLVPD